MNDKKIKSKIVSVIYIHIFPLLLFLSLEILNVSAYEDMYSSVLDNIPALVMSCVFIYAVILLTFTLSGNIFSSCSLVSVILFTFYAVNYCRRVMTGNVMIPPDLNFVKQASFIMSFSTPAFEARVAYSALCVLIILVPLFFVSRDLRLSVRKRITGLFMTMFIMFFVFFSPFSYKIILASVNIDPLESINQLYEDNGAIMGFYTLCITDESEAPQGYSKERMESIVSQVLENSGAYTEHENIRPNVIVIMSEAFTDPLRLPAITYSEDPAPNLRLLTKRETSGYIVTPSFGGLTCNPEYEFLTGNSMLFTGYGDTPYYAPERYIDNDVGRSLASMFRENGYKTIGLHTNAITFYDRDKHYPKLGFDEFIGEEMMPDAKYKGALPTQKLISDEYFMDKLLETVDNTAQPLFIFGITMQNHSTYLPDKYESTAINAESGLLTEEDISYLETYLEGVRDADEQLGRLYEYVMHSDRPTIAAYFGDHLPVITQNTGIYSELGYISNHEIADLTTKEIYKMYTTPYVVFSNYKNLPETWGNISPYFLGALLADSAGIEKNLYYVFLMQAYDCFNAITEKLYVAKDGSVEASLPENEDKIEMFRLIQYDKLFGQNYADDAMSNLIGDIVQH